MANIRALLDRHSYPMGSALKGAVFLAVRSAVRVNGLAPGARLEAECLAPNDLELRGAS